MGQHRPPLLPHPPPPPPQFRNGPSDRYAQTSVYRKPHPYSVPQHSAPHPYRRASCQPAPAYRPVVEKREEVVEVDMEDVEPQREIYQKHLTAEAKKDAEECGTELNLSTEDLDRAADLRHEFHDNLKNLSAAIGKSVKNKTREDITKHRLELLDRRLKDTEKRREAVEKKPVQCFVFERPDDRVLWLNQRAAERNQRLTAKKAKWVDQKACRDALMTKFKDFHVDKDCRLEEVNRKARDEAEQRLQLNEQEKIKLFTEWAAETDQQAREEHKKAETAAIKAYRAVFKQKD